MSVKAETNLFHDVGFKLHEGDVLILQGKSGSGYEYTLQHLASLIEHINKNRKSTLVKSLAHLNLYDGDILFRGK